MNMEKTASTITTINKKIISLIISMIINMIISMIISMITVTRVTIKDNNMKVLEWKLPFFTLFVIWYLIFSRRHSKYWPFDFFTFHFLFGFRQGSSCWGMEQLALFWPRFNLHILNYCDHFDFPNCKKLLLSHHGIHSQYRYGSLDQKGILVGSWSFWCSWPTHLESKAR